MQTNLRHINLLYREPHRDQSSADHFEGDIIEIDEPPFSEIDPVTRKAKNSLQCFRVGRGGRKLTPVKRGSWL